MGVQLPTADSNLLIAGEPFSPFACGWDADLETTDDSRISGSRFVPCQLVHKRAAAQVLLTDGIRLGQDTFVVAAVLSADHGLAQRDAESRIDPMQAVEALRQVGYYISHRFHAVPDTHEFILGGVTLRVDDPGVLAANTPRLPINLLVTCTPTAKWTRRRLGMRLDVELSVAGQVCGHGSLLSEAVDPRVYQVVRHRHATGEPAVSPSAGRLLQPADVGRRSAADVLLAEVGRAEGWLLQVDQGHAVMFDHPVDHVPGMVLLEALRQAAFAVTRTLAGRRVRFAGIRTKFVRFCELDAPTWVSARPQLGHPFAGQAMVQVAAEQNGAQVASGVVELRLDDRSERDEGTD